MNLSTKRRQLAIILLACLGIGAVTVIVAAHLHDLRDIIPIHVLHYLRHLF